MENPEKNINRSCDCELWKNNIKKINDPMMFYYQRFNIEYDGVIFKYCPWCGKLLQSED